MVMINCFSPEKKASHSLGNVKMKDTGCGFLQLIKHQNKKERFQQENFCWKPNRSCNKMVSCKHSGGKIYHKSTRIFLRLESTLRSV